MNNMIQFKTAPRPLDYGRSRFPYDAILKSLRSLKSTDSIVLRYPEEINNNNLIVLRNKAKRSDQAYIRACKKDGNCYLWMKEVDHV